MAGFCLLPPEKKKKTSGIIPDPIIKTTVTGFFPTYFQKSNCGISAGTDTEMGRQRFGTLADLGMLLCISGWGVCIFCSLNSH